MESIEYRKSKILVKTIPKDTLLFRLTKTPENDTRGVPIEKGRCITPNMNVFFHPNPFIGNLAYTEFTKDIGTSVSIYTLTNDIKVLMLIEPSKYSRLDRKKKGSFIKRCSTVKKGCMPKNGNSYDPCFSDTIIKKYPDIVGMIAIAAGDVKYMKAALKRGIKEKTRKIFHKAKDSFGVEGVPELILHPLTKRPSKDMIVSPEDKLENNYTLMKTVPYNEDELHKFMEEHAVYNTDTYFFGYRSS
jgi:hypothetical protein